MPPPNTDGKFGAIVHAAYAEGPGGVGVRRAAGKFGADLSSASVGLTMRRERELAALLLRRARRAGLWRADRL